MHSLLRYIVILLAEKLYISCLSALKKHYGNMNLAELIYKPLRMTSSDSSLKQLFMKGYLLMAIESDFINDGRKVCLMFGSELLF